MITPQVNTQTLALLGSLYRDSPRNRRGTLIESNDLPPAMGHVFAIESSVAGVRCRGCGQAYAVHQHAQTACPLPGSRECAERKPRPSRAKVALARVRTTG